MAIARLASVTVSIALEIIGIFNFIAGVMFVVSSVWFGSTLDAQGFIKTSSKVRASTIIN